MKCFFNAESLYIMHNILYHYMVRENLSLTRKFKEKKYNELMYVNDTIETLVKKHIKYNYRKIEEALLYIRLKNVYSCFNDIFRKESNYNFKKRIKYISEILSVEKNINYSIIKDWKFKVLSFFLKINSNIIIYVVSKLLNLYKRIYSPK